MRPPSVPDAPPALDGRASVRTPPPPTRSAWQGGAEVMRRAPSASPQIGFPYVRGVLRAVCWSGGNAMAFLLMPHQRMETCRCHKQKGRARIERASSPVTPRWCSGNITAFRIENALRAAPPALNFNLRPQPVYHGCTLTSLSDQCTWKFTLIFSSVILPSHQVLLPRISFHIDTVFNLPALTKAWFDVTFSKNASRAPPSQKKIHNSRVV